MADIVIVLGSLFPRQFQQRLDISPQHIGLLAAGGHIFQTSDLFGQLLPCLRISLQPGNFVLIFFQIILPVILSQLLPDDSHLLSQHIVLLVLVDLGPYLVLKLLFQLSHFDLYDQMADQHLIESAFGRSLQDLLADRIIPRNLDGRLDHQPVQFRNQHEI